MKNRNLNKAYLVVGCKTWNRLVFDKVISKYPGQWHFIGDKTELNPAELRSLNPRYIFFLHWSWKVPDEIVKVYECVCFHMTDVPYGRGGSPLQNLIIRGHEHTKLTALRMVEELDAGPVYLKEDLPIESGPAEEIYIRATYKAAAMIKKIIDEEPMPIPQQGKPMVFQRRRPEESEIPDLENLRQLYNFIRMLAAEGYPNAFLALKGFRFEFSKAILKDNKLETNVTITKSDKDKVGEL